MKDTYSKDVGKEKGSIWLTTYKKSHGSERTKETNIKSLDKTLQLRFMARISMTLPLTSLVCKNTLRKFIKGYKFLC